MSVIDVVIIQFDMQQLDGKRVTLDTGTHHIASGEVG